MTFDIEQDGFDEENPPVPITQIDYDPNNSVIGTPSGKVFIYLEPFIGLQLEMAKEALAEAKDKNDERGEIYIHGFVGMLKVLTQANEHMKMQSLLERTEKTLDLSDLDFPDQ